MIPEDQKLCAAQLFNLRMEEPQLVQMTTLPPISFDIGFTGSQKLTNPQRAEGLRTLATFFRTPEPSSILAGDGQMLPSAGGPSSSSVSLRSPGSHDPPGHPGHSYLSGPLGQPDVFFVLQIILLLFVILIFLLLLALLVLLVLHGFLVLLLLIQLH